MDFNAAILAHSKWKIRLKNYINGDDPIDQAAAGSDKQCELGKWIGGEGKKYASLSAFADMKSKHAAFHREAARVIANSKSCPRERALELIDPFKSDFGRASSAVVNALTALKAAVS